MDHGVLSSSVSWDGKTIPRLENINEQAYNHEVKEAAEESIVRNNFSGCRVVVKSPIESKPNWEAVSFQLSEMEKWYAAVEWLG